MYSWSMDNGLGQYGQELEGVGSEQGYKGQEINGHDVWWINNAGWVWASLL